MIGFNRRFDPNFKRVHDLVAEGAVGTPHVLKITSRDPAPPPIAYVKVSGGIFLDMTIHDFDNDYPNTVIVGDAQRVSRDLPHA